MISSVQAAKVTHCWQGHVEDLNILISYSPRVSFYETRSYAALQAADLDWIVGPGYSSGRYILEKNHEKPTWNHEKPWKNDEKPT